MPRLEPGTPQTRRNVREAERAKRMKAWARSAATGHGATVRALAIVADRKHQDRAERAYRKWSQGGTSAKGRRSRHQEY